MNLKNENLKLEQEDAILKVSSSLFTDETKEYLNLVDILLDASIEDS